MAHCGQGGQRFEYSSRRSVNEVSRRARRSPSC
jgi:hypothetical protein